TKTTVLRLEDRLVLRERIELSTSPLPRECSTTELPQRLQDAADFCHKDRRSASRAVTAFASCGKVRQIGRQMLASGLQPHKDRGWFDRYGERRWRRRKRRTRVTTSARRGLPRNC